MTLNQFERTNALLRRYCAHVDKILEERWSSIELDLYDPTAQEVAGGLLARQATLSTELAMAPSVCNGHIAPLVLRAMIDVEWL